MTEQEQDAQSPAPQYPTRREARNALRRQKARWSSGFTTLRDLVSFLLGASIITHEVFITGKPELYIVAVGVAFTGLPIVLGADERKSK